MKYYYSRVNVNAQETAPETMFTFDIRHGDEFEFNAVQTSDAAMADAIAQALAAAGKDFAVFKWQSDDDGETIVCNWNETSVRNGCTIR